MFLGVLTGISCILGGILAAYVLARPLLLYRYESVALDEEMADKEVDDEALVDAPARSADIRLGTPDRKKAVKRPMTPDTGEHIPKSLKFAKSPKFSTFNSHCTQVKRFCIVEK